MDACLRDPWCQALHQCTACLREQNVEYADTCLAYLVVLEQKLEETVKPNNEDNDVDDDDDDDTDKEASWKRRVPEKFPPHWRRFCANYNNVTDGWREEEEEEEEDETTTHNNDKIIQDPAPHLRLSRQRLLTRIFTSQSEVFAMKATYMVKNSTTHTTNDTADSRWTMAASSYQYAILKIHQALDVTDTAISHWWNRVENIGNDDGQFGGGKSRLPLPMDKEKELLVRDASIVVVSLESLTDRRQKLLSAGKREEAKLLRKLQPQWESRDEVKQRMGEDRWKNNPQPKHDHSRLRIDYEGMLRSLQQALQSLEELDPRDALRKASDLQEQLLVVTDTTVPSTQTQTQTQKRYNNRRPLPEWIEQRVSFQEYPDPTELGWTFTGSWKANEFFERMVMSTSQQSTQQQQQQQHTLLVQVKLDWYFTTGTVKTSLDHPVQGKTQLFAKKCNPTLYRQVLTHPRTHTGKRYHRKKKK